MPVQVAEYLGQRVDGPEAVPPHNLDDNCPFTNDHCIKIKRKRGINFPICSVLTNAGLYIVCPNRIFPTNKKNFRASHRGMLYLLAQRLLPGVSQASFRFKRKVVIRLNLAIDPETGEESFDKVELDYVLRNLTPTLGFHDRVILEVQGGGETGNTGVLSEHVEGWLADEVRTNERLFQRIGQVSTIENNAWKRQLEQLIRKTKIAESFGGSVAMAVGSPVYKYFRRFLRGGHQTLEDCPTWSVALIEMHDTWSRPGQVEFAPRDLRFFTIDEFFDDIRNFPMETDANPFAGGGFLDMSGQNCHLDA